MIDVTRTQARAALLGQTGLNARVHPPGAEGARALLRALRCIQLDPLDRIGTNADLVAWARVDGLKRGDLYAHLLPGHAFEHLAKVRCLLPASAFPYYRDRTAALRFWALDRRLKELPEGLIERVYQQVRAHGPVTPAELDHGEVDGEDWSGWKTTARASTLAMEALWSTCRVVVTERRGNGKAYDVPERALPDHHDGDGGDFARWAIVERAEASGLLPTAMGPHWAMLRQARTDGVPEALVAEGALAEVTIEGSRRRWYAPPDLMERSFPEPDDELRILGPLDPLLWDRTLVRILFDFEYVWEVYKPKAQRKWGYYVCPLLHRGQLVGRFEAHREDGRVVVDQLWVEPGRELDRDAFDRALARIEAAQ